MAFILALCIAAALLTPASAAGVTAREIAQAYQTVLSGTTLRARVEKPVLFYDLTGDGAPEMLLLAQSRSGTELQIWTHQNGSAQKVLSLDWVEVSASKHWLYLQKDGTLAWYYTNSGYDYPYASVSHMGSRYVWHGSTFALIDTFEYYYLDDGTITIPAGAKHNNVDISNAEGAALDADLRSQAIRTLMYLGGGAPEGMTKSEAQAYLGSITGRFFDVPAGKYYTDPVAWAVESGITNGTSAYTFSPDRPCTRGQAVTFLWRAAGQPAPKEASTRFTDLTPGAFYEKAVTWAVESGITDGTAPNRFSPDKPCSRAQIVTFLWRAAGSPAVAGGSGFADVPADSYYAMPVRWAVFMDITRGVTDTRFAPNDPCTRGQIVTFLYRARNVKIDPKPDAWSDAYKSFVLNQAFLNSGPEYSYDAGFFLVRLYDLDRDGTPELIIDNGGTGRAVRWAYIYTYYGGQVRYLDIGPSETYCDPSNPAGVYGRYSLSPDENWTKYDKTGTRIVTSSAGTFPLFTGHPDFRPLTTRTVEQIRDMGWDAFLNSQALE